MYQKPSNQKEKKIKGEKREKQKDWKKQELYRRVKAKAPKKN